MNEREMFVQGFSRRQDGNMALHCGEPRGTLDARRRFLSGIGITPRQMVVPCQVHGKRITIARLIDRGRGVEDFATGIADTDALVTGERQTTLAMQTADCLPILMYAPDGPACAAVHAGWKSTWDKIAALTVECLHKEFGAMPAAIRCFLGPSIRPCCYQVGEEFAGAFPHSIIRRDDKIYFNLIQENCRQLFDAGVRPENIFDSGYCTCCNPDYFSFRREGETTGRMLAAIMLK